METKLNKKEHDVRELTKLLSTKKSTDSETSKELFHLISYAQNPDYISGLKTLPPFVSCQEGNNDTSKKSLKSRKKSFNEYDPSRCEFVVKTRPKWNTKLGYYNVSKSTGEIESKGEYLTDDFKKANGRKIKSMDAFASHYEALYRKRKTSLMFHTFTRANRSRMSFRRMLHLTRKRYKSIGYNVTGYVWTAEVSERLHWHYHLVLALDKRMTVKKIPNQLMLDDLWGQHTRVEFVKKDVRHYMAKYFAKHNARVLSTRSYGKSRNFE